MSTLSWILLFALLGGLMSALASSSFLIAPPDTRRRLVPHLVSFATGTLLGAALLGLRCRMRSKRRALIGCTLSDWPA
ncbi:MAG: hypothetical protein AAF610_02200 [Pseudomonadota bacterium]